MRQSSTTRFCLAWRVIHDTCVLSEMLASLIVKLPVHKELCWDAPNCLDPSPGTCHAPSHFRTSFIYCQSKLYLFNDCYSHQLLLTSTKHNYKNGIDFVFFTRCLLPKSACLKWGALCMQRSFEVLYKLIYKCSDGSKGLPLELVLQD